MMHWKLDLAEVMMRLDAELASTRGEGDQALQQLRCAISHYMTPGWVGDAARRDIPELEIRVDCIDKAISMLLRIQELMNSLGGSVSYTAALARAGDWLNRVRENSLHLCASPASAASTIQEDLPPGDACDLLLQLMRDASTAGDMMRRAVDWATVFAHSA